MKSTVCRRLLGVSLAIVALTESSGSELSIRVFPPAAYASCDVLVQAIIERDARNRSVEFVIDSGGFFSSSTAELEGGNAPRVKQVTFRRLPAGNYQIRVTVIGTDGRRATVMRYIDLL